MELVTITNALREAGRVSVEVVERTDAKTLGGFVENGTHPDAVVYTSNNMRTQCVMEF